MPEVKANKMVDYEIDPYGCVCKRIKVIRSNFAEGTPIAHFVNMSEGLLRTTYRDICAELKK